MFAVNHHNWRDRYRKDLDFPLLIAIVMLASFGLLEISSAEPSPGLWQRQAVGILIGLAVLFTTTLIGYRKFVDNGIFLYIIGLIFLALVLTPLGKEVNGNRSWLHLGPLRFQPSEFAKIFTIIYLASFLSRFQVVGINLRSLKGRPLKLILQELNKTIFPWVKFGLIWALPTALVFLENDTGSALSYTSFLGAMFLLIGIPRRWLLAGLVAGIVLISAAAPFGIAKLKNCKSYKCERIKAVYWPDLAEKRFRYQNEQAEIAVGSGGVFGKGLRGSTQGTLGFVPEVHNDFIFAVASEEWGFVGGFLVLVAYLLIINQLINTACESRERSGILLVAGVTALLLYHVTVNVGMVLRLLPIMGIPLPLMSSGSTSVVATCFGLGLAMSVRLDRYVN